MRVATWNLDPKNPRRNCSDCFRPTITLPTTITKKQRAKRKIMEPRARVGGALQAPGSSSSALWIASHRRSPDASWPFLQREMKEHRIKNHVFLQTSEESQIDHLPRYQSQTPNWTLQPHWPLPFNHPYPTGSLCNSCWLCRALMSFKPNSRC